MRADARGAAREELRRLLHRGIVSGGDLEEAATLLRRGLAGDASVIDHGTTPFGPLGRADHVPEAWVDEYREVAHLDPVVGWLDASPLGTIFQATAQSVHPELARAFYRHEWSDLAVVLLPSVLGPPIFIALYRRAGRFDARELAELGALHSLLADALATRTALAAIDAPRDETLPAALRRVVTHARVSLPSGTCQWADGAGLALGARAGRAFSRADLARLEPVLVAIVAQRHRERRHRFVLGLRAELAWLPPEPGETRRALLLLVAEPSSAIDADAPVLAALTPRQREVALAVAEGRSLPEIARRLGVSPETARTHLRAALEVLGVESRAALTQLLSH